MSILILSGLGGSANWLPMVLPLAIIFLILFGTDTTLKYLKRRKRMRQLRLEQELEAKQREQAQENEEITHDFSAHTGLSASM